MGDGSGTTTPDWLDAGPAVDEPPVVPLWLARELADAGLAWEPSEGDRFVVPGAELVDRVFMVSSMVVEVRHGVGGRVIHFNGTTEWALDQILTEEALWLPAERDLRLALGERFVGLRRSGAGWRAEVAAGGGTVPFDHPDVVGALGLAVVAVLQADSGTA